MKKITIHKTTSFKEAEKFDIRFWQRAGAEARFSAMWIMVGEFLKIRGKPNGQPRLRRSVQSIKYLTGKARSRK